MDKFWIIDDTEKKQKRIRVIGIIILTCLNAIKSNEMPFSLILTFIEVGIVFYCLLFKKLSTFILFFLLMTGASIENPAYAYGDRNQTFCSFIMIPGIATYHLYFMLLIADLRAIKQIPKIIYKNTKLMKFTRFFLLLFFLQIFSTGITYLINDNGILQIQGLFNYTVRDALNMIMIVSIVLIMSTCLISEENFKEKFMFFIEEFLIGVVISAAILVLSKNYYVKQMGATKQLTCTLAFLITPTMILLFWSRKKTIVFLIFGILSILIQKEYTLGIAGAWWLMVCITAVLFIMCSIPARWNKREVFKFLILLFGIIFVFKFIKSGGNIENGVNNYQVYYKLEAFKRILNWKSNIKIWYLGLGDSIQGRIEEVINIFIEFCHKPWFFLTGKGFGGTVLKYWGASNWNGESTYSQVQMSAGVYSVLHTGIAEIFLNSGVIGLLLCVYIMIISIKKALSKKRNMWCFIGMWGIILFHQLISLSIEVAILCYGLYLDNNAEKDTIKYEYK